jgi:UDP-4-amino-4,6-dideoxy-N-acetyl-beta-L-altrosamine N-acetyltransferase
MKKIELLPILEATQTIQDSIRKIRNMENIRKFMYTDHIISEEEHNQWLENMENNNHQLVYVILYDKKPIGAVNIYNINRVHKTTDWGFYITEELRGKGIGTIVEYMILEKIFNELNIEKLNCEVLETNPIAIKLHKKFGFIEEGIRKKNVIKQNLRIDVHLFGLLKDEWTQHKQKIQKTIDRISKREHDEDI